MAIIQLQRNLSRPHLSHPRIQVTVYKEGKRAEITLSAWREFDRIHRIGQVAFRLPVSVLDKLTELHDHKGNLAVVWAVLPTAADVSAVQQAWEAECECITSHFYNGALLLSGFDDPPPPFANILEDEIP